MKTRIEVKRNEVSSPADLTYIIQTAISARLRERCHGQP